MFRFAKTIAIAAGALVAISATSQAQVIYGHENSNLKVANQAMLAGDLEKASEFFRRAVRADLGQEKLVTALNNFCAVEYAIGNHESAVDACSKAIGEDRRYWRAYVNRGNARAAIGNLEAAKSDFERAVKLKPNSRIAQNALLSFQKSDGSLLADAGH